MWHRHILKYESAALMHCAEEMHPGPGGQVTSALPYHPHASTGCLVPRSPSTVQLEADRIALRLIQKLLAADRTARAWEAVGTLHNLPALEGALKLANHHRCVCCLFAFFCLPTFCCRSRMRLCPARLPAPRTPSASPANPNAGATLPPPVD